jgi:hypothetical protein
LVAGVRREWSEWRFAKEMLRNERNVLMLMLLMLLMIKTA